MAQLTDTKARNITPDTKPLAAGGVPGVYLFTLCNSGQGQMDFPFHFAGHRQAERHGTWNLPGGWHCRSSQGRA